MNRRKFLRVSAVALGAGAAGCVRGAGAVRTDWAASFDREMEAFMAARQVPGGALAVVRNRRLVYARGYGWADRENRRPVRVDSLFRIASVSKPVTGVAVMKLIEDGRLKLDEPAFPVLGLAPAVASFRDPEPRLRRISVRQLLHHTGGWDREKSFDPMFRPRRIAQAIHVPTPAGAVDVIRYMLSQPLDFDPGTRYAYSNYGYCVLGRLIEKVSGLSYERYVRERILAPIGVTRMKIGATPDDRQAPGEVRYYTAPERLEPNVFPGGPEQVPAPYGGFHLEAMDAHGGWIASVLDLARFAAALDDPVQCPLLKPATLAVMSAPPPAPVSRRPDGTVEDSFYAAGWSVRPTGAPGRANYWHSGSLPGTSSLLVRRHDGLSWVALFNQRSEDKSRPDSAIDPALHRAAAAVTRWPEGEPLVPGAA